MKQIILIFILFFSFINITNAIPIPALVIGGDFFLLSITIILGFFSFIYFYLRKYIFWINIYLLLISIILYFIHFFITDGIFLFNYEYFIFVILLLILFLIYKFQKIKFLNYFLVFTLIFFNIFFVKINYNLYEFKNIAYCIEKNMYSNIRISKILYKDNFLATYIVDIETGKNAYNIISLTEKHCLNKGKYYICNGGNNFLQIGISNLAYNCIKD